MAAPGFLQQRRMWTALVAAAAAAFWVVGIGVGARAWILVTEPVGIVAHTDAFGQAAGTYWIVAAVLTLTAAVMAIGTAVVRHLADSPVLAPATPAVPEDEPVAELPEAELTEVQDESSGDLVELGPGDEGDAAR